VSTLDEIKRTKGLYVRCPTCQEPFAARKAELFDAKGPLPGRVVEHLRKERAAVADELLDLNQERADLTRRSFAAAASSGVGQALEMLSASLPGLPAEASDCRVLLKPIHYVAFLGASGGAVSGVRFIEVQTGARQLSRVESSVRQAIRDGSVSLRIADHRLSVE
jgi:predicted Holliday junction resolvase-like endonuclease